MAQRIDPKTGLPLPSGPLANSKSSSTFHISVAQVGKPMAGPPAGLSGSDLKAAASQYVQQHLASLGAGAAAHLGALYDVPGTAPAVPAAGPYGSQQQKHQQQQHKQRRTGGGVIGLARVSSGDAPLIHHPSGVTGAAAGRDNDSALSLGAPMGGAHQQHAHHHNPGFSYGLGRASIGDDLAASGAGTPMMMFAVPNFGAGAAAGMGMGMGALGVCGGGPGSPLRSSSGGADDTKHVPEGRRAWREVEVCEEGDECFDEGRMSEDLEEMLQSMQVRKMLCR